MHRLLKALLTGLLATLAEMPVAGCQPARRPNTERQAELMTGVAGAIDFKTSAEGDPRDGSALTFVDAVRWSLQNDPRVRSSLAKVRVAEADANQARLLPNPILTIDLRFPLTKGSNTAFEPSLAADLLSLLQKPSQIAAADKRLRASAQTALLTVLDVMAEVQQAFVSAHAVELELENADRRQARLQKLRDLAKKRLDAGESTRLDLLTVDSQLLQASIALSDLRLQRTQSRLLLAKLLGRPRDAGEWSLEPYDLDERSLVTPVESWITMSITHRPEIIASTWELKALGDDYATTYFAPLAGGDIAAHGEHDPDWRLGPSLNLPLPIFDFGQAARQKISATQAVARADLDEQIATIIQDVRLAYATDRHARETLEDYRMKLLPLQVQQTEQAKNAYQAGEADLATLILAENDLELTRSKMIELREAAAVARIKLRRAAGGAGLTRELEQPLAATQPASATRSSISTTQAASGPASQSSTDSSATRPLSGEYP